MPTKASLLKNQVKKEPSEKLKSTNGLFLKILMTEFHKYVDSEIIKCKEEILKEIGVSKEYLTVKEVCKMYKISPSTLERFIRDGLKVYSTGKHCSRKFLKQELDHYLEYRGKLNRAFYGKIR